MNEVNLDLPTLTRLLAFEESGHSRDDLFAGLCYAQPAAQLTIGSELRELAESGRTELALELCSQLLTHVVHPYAKYYLLAYAAMWSDQLGQVDRGLDYAREAIALLEPLAPAWAAEGRAWACNQLAWPLLTRGEFAQARDWALRGLQDDPDNGNLHSTLGSALFELGDQSAYSSLEAAIKRGVAPAYGRLREDERYRELARAYQIPLPKSDGHA